MNQVDHNEKKLQTWWRIRYAAIEEVFAMLEEMHSPGLRHWAYIRGI